MSDATFRLRFEEQGADVPDRASRQLRGLALAQREMVEGFVPTAVAGAQVDRQLDRIGTTSLASAKGLSVVRSAMSAVAFEATGTAGPVGRLASGLLLFTGGSTLTLGVVAGVGAIATGYRFLTRDAREAAEAQKAVLDAQHAVAAARAPAAGRFQEAQAAADAANQILQDLTTKRDRILRGELVAPPDFFGATGTFETARRNAEIATNTAARARDEMIKARQELERAMAIVGPLLRPSALDPSLARGPNGERLTGFLPLPRQTGAQLTPLSGLVPARGDPEFVRQAIKTAGEEAKGFSEDITLLTESMNKAGPAAELAAAQMLTAFAGLIQIFSAGGSPGRLLGGIGSLVGTGIKGLFAGNPLLGAGIGLVGAVLGGGRRQGVQIEGYSQAALEQLRALPSAPQRFELVVIAQETGAVINRVLVEAGRRQRVDAVPRILLPSAA